ncbi:two-component hybrid sensor and regulator [Bdellovibrio sp. ZAP7]|uniref:PAS domain S-box protein n=1 Tax=Bdellovibrio sp. ZAP7 TaxID=2231053 RepID=UPI00115C4121|nr:PAS domain S-box protein [Bdellovibrio sp. ZAP7]QDK46490.1 two-component hybrid sensor and regulator [Bdellovibrio sp. ZAP7]
MNDNRELQRRYLTIFNSKIIGIISTNSHGQILDANDYFLELLGYSHADLKAGKLNWKILTPPDLIGESLKLQERLLAAPGISVSLEKEYFHKDGHRIPVRIGVTTFEDGTDITLVQDISRQKKIEKELANANELLESRVEMRTGQLAESEAFLLGIIETMPSMVFVKEAQNLAFVRLNRAGEKMLGISREEFIGKTDYDFFSKELAERFRSMDRKVLNGEIPHAITEDEIPTRNGTRQIHTIKIPVRDKDGHPRFILGVSEDITDRIEAARQREDLVRAQAEKEAAEARARQERFVSGLTFELSSSVELGHMLRAFCVKVVPALADICIVEIIDEEGMDYIATEIYATNSEEEEFVRRWRAENPPKWDPEFGGPTIIRSGKTILLRGLEQIGPHIRDHYDIEIQVKNPNQDAKLFSESLMFIPLMARDKAPLGLVSLVSTKSKRMFNERDQSLAEEVCSRLAVLIENTRLYDRAQEASRAKSDFLANVSHEIRTPLGAMLGFAEILSDDKTLTREQMHAVETVLRNGQQLLRIVNEILDISKIESEKIQVENIVFGVRELLEDVTYLLRVKAEEKGVELRLRMGTVRDNLISDPGRIRQILINMVGNAIKFTERGYVELRAEAIPTRIPDRYILQFVVTDTGIGISQEQRAHLFQPFSQADSSTTRRFGGTGLGLFLSRKLARLLGGDITFTSVVGKGSRFLISVVAHAPSVKAPEEPPKKEHVVNAAGTYLQAGVILVVDDSADNRDLLRHYLKKAGLDDTQIEMASNGEEAVRKASSKNYRMILMDIQMPHMDGFQALKKLRGQGYECPVIALTAHAMKGDREKCLEAGFDGYLQKPLRKEALNEVLNTDFRY